MTSCQMATSPAIACLVASYHHARSPRHDPDMARRIAELCTRPCLSALRRVCIVVDGPKHRYKNHLPVTPELVAAYLMDESALYVHLDNGRSTEPVACGWFVTNLGFTPDPQFLAPMNSYVIVPYDPETRDDTIATMLAMAETLEAAFGMISLESSYQSAHNAANAGGGEMSERGPGKLMTPERLRYRRMPDFRGAFITESIGGPEWGTILGPGHVARLSLDELRRSGAFHEVRELSHGGAFVRLSEDPMDTRSLTIVDMVARGREALAPICMNVDDIRINLE
jgi:hypothetical protein